MSGKSGAGPGASPHRLDVNIRNFGPIKRASISLRPLTIFIGPSGTGKSCAAMLAHSIISAGKGAGAQPHPPADSADRAGRLKKNLMGIKGVLAGMKPGEAADCPPALAAQVVRSCGLGLARRMRGELERNFGAPLDRLAGPAPRRFSVSLESGGNRVITCGSRCANLNCMQYARIRFRLATLGRRGPCRAARSAGGAITCTVERDLAAEANMSQLQQVYEELEREVLEGAMSLLPAASQYFPAGRAGMLRVRGASGQEAAGGAMDGSAGVIQAPRLQGAISDFAARLAEMRPRHGPCDELGRRMEMDVLGGRVLLKAAAGKAAPALAYRRRHGRNVPLHLASSDVSELAPLTLYLRHSARRDGMLAVEEPEAHLHPSSQRLLARHIVRLVRGGIVVLVTTHSAILLEVVSQCLQAHKLPAGGRRRALGDRSLHLGMDEVAPHFFRLDLDGMAVVEKIPMSVDEGISQEEFIGVDRILSMDNVRIEEYGN